MFQTPDARFVRTDLVHRRNARCPKGFDDAWLTHFRNQTLRARRQLHRVEEQKRVLEMRIAWNHDDMDRLIKLRDRAEVRVEKLEKRLRGESQ